MTFLNPFERKERNFRWLTYLLALLFLLAVYAMASFFFGNLIGLVLCVPIVGVYSAVFLVNHAGASYRWAYWLTWRKVNGHYQTFDDREVCIEWRAQHCRVATADVFRVMQLKPDAMEHRKLGVRHGSEGFYRDERGIWWFSEPALLNWLKPRAERMDERAIRLLRWLEKEVFPPMHKKAEIEGL